MHQARRSLSALAKRWTGCLMTAAMATGASAQYDPPPLSLWNSVEIYSGNFSLNTPPLDRQGIMSLLAGSSLASSKILADHHFDPGSDRVGMEGSVTGAALGLLPFRHGDATGPELRIGILHGSRSTRSGLYRKTTWMPHDTLTSAGTGEEYRLDSVTHDTYRISHGSERLGLTASLTWQSRGRWRFHGGIGLQGGLHMNARTEVEHMRTVRLMEREHGWYMATLAPSLMEKETTSPGGGTGWWFGAYLPLGLDFQIARKGYFWSRMRLFMELRPQLVADGIHPLDPVMAAGFATLSGLRFSLQTPHLEPAPKAPAD